MTNNLSSYRIFCTVAKAGNISSAARELFISQPAVSKAISKLEQSLNVTLFERTSRGVSLTYEGKLLFTQVEGAFHSIEQGEKQIQRIAELGVGHLSLGVSTTLCKFVLLPYLKEFIHANPHIQLSISCQSTSHTLFEIEKGDVEIGLVGEPEMLGNLDFFPVSKIHDIFVTTPEYLNNLRIREGGVSFDIFKSATLILLDKDNITRQYIDKYLSSNHLQPENIIEVSTMDLLIEFAKTGLGIACVIKEFVEKDLTENTLTEYVMSTHIPPRKIGFVYPKTTKPSVAMTQFIDFYKNPSKNV
ncbi:MAG: LysR family transcriptional regulator [Lachnospiraceae bacterium]|nr:LysR family transcriptional regulator [Lachnospiraceae bacterium]